MTAIIYQLRDFQRPKDLARMNKELEQQAVDILNAAKWGGGIDSLIPHYHDDDKKPA